MHVTNNMFAQSKGERRAVLAEDVTCGYSSIAGTSINCLNLQSSKTGSIVLGILFIEPEADGPALWKTGSTVAMNGVTISMAIEAVRTARHQGLRAPLLLMCCYNTFIRYGKRRLLNDCKDAGVDGFVFVDLPSEHNARFSKACARRGLANISLEEPIMLDKRLRMLYEIVDSAIHAVSKMDVASASRRINSTISELFKSVKRAFGSIPLAIAAGVCTRAYFSRLRSLVNAIEVGRQTIHTSHSAASWQTASTIKQSCSRVTTQGVRHRNEDHQQHFHHISIPRPQSERQDLYLRCTVDVETEPVVIASQAVYQPKKADHQDFFISSPTNSAVTEKPVIQRFGGKYAPELLMDYLYDLEIKLQHIKSDKSFWEEYHSYDPLVGRPSPLVLAVKLTQQWGGPSVYLKREDLCYTGSYKINNALGQLLLAKRLGMKRIVAECGSGQHGVAVATLCSKFDMQCVVYMGAKDVKRQVLNVQRIKLLGAKLIVVEAGSGTKRDAMNEAFRNWIANLDTTHFAIGSACGPSPIPAVVRMFNSVIGAETRQQMIQTTGDLPSAVVTCVGTGANAAGMFSPFLDDTDVKLVGVEAGGDETSHSAVLSSGSVGVLHGAMTYVLQDDHGQISDTHSIAAGLDYAAVSPDLATWKNQGRASFLSVTDSQALQAFQTLAAEEGILPSLESAHAISGAMTLAKTMSKDESIVICLTGSGEKDIPIIMDQLRKESAIVDSANVE